MAAITISVNASQAAQLIGSVNQSLAQMGQQINTVNVYAKQHLNFLDQISRQYQIIIQSRVFFGVLEGLQQANEEAQKLARQVTEIQTISQDLAQSSATWTQNIIALSNKLGSSATDVAAATYQTLSSNIAGARENTEKFVETAGRFAQVTQTTAKGGVNLLGSAINSFGLSAADADRVASVLFNTIASGRVRAENIENIFGRIGVQAHNAGLSIEETSAAIATLSVKGLKETEVITQLNALLTGFIKPNKELTETFLQLGFASPEAALRTQGLVETLRQLQSITKGLSENAVREFSNRRGVQGFLGLDPDKLQSELDSIQGAQAKFGNALKITQDSVSNQLDRFKQQFVNTFIAIGTESNAAIVNLLRGFDRIGVSTHDLTLTLTVLATGGTIAVATAGLARLGATAGIAATDFAFLTSVVQALGFTASNAIPIIGVFAAAFGAGLVFFKETPAEIRKTEIALQNVAAQAKKTAEEFAKVSLKDSRDSAPKETIQVLAIVTQNLIQKFNAIKPASDAAFDNIKARAQATLDGAREKVRDFEREIQDTFRNIANAEKGIGEAQTSSRKALIDFQKEFANPQQLQGLLKSEIEDQTDLAKRLFREAGAATGSTATEKLKEANAAIEETKKLIIELNREQVRQGGGQANPRIVQSQLQDVDTLQKNLSRQFENAQDRNINRPSGKDDIGGLRAQQNVADEAFRKQVIAAKEFEAIIKQGEEHAIKLSEVYHLATVANVTLLDSEKEVLAVRNNILKESLANFSQQQDRREAQQRADTLKQEASNERKALADQKEVAQARKDLDFAISELRNAGGHFGGRALFPDEGKDAIAQQLISVNKLLDSGKIPEALSALKVLRDALTTPESAVFTNKALQQLEKFGEQIQKIRDKEAELETLREQNADAFSKTFTEATKDTNTAVKILQGLTEGVKTNVDDSAKRAEELAKQFALAAKAAREIKITIPTPSNVPSGGGEPPIGEDFGTGGLASGGIGFGVDTINTRIAPGETVLPSRVFQLFGNQLRQAFADSRTSSTSNITNGDVNVFVQGTGYTEKDIRNIMDAMRREQRRGTTARA